MKKGIIIAALIVLSVSGCRRQKDIVCGVPVQGTPWELAAAIHDYGDGHFVPECVTIYENKGYIKGPFL